MFKFIFALLLAATPALGAEKIVLGEHNTVALRSEVSFSSMTALSLELAAKVIKRGSQNYPIYLVLDTPGGSIDAGLTFISFAKHVRNLKTVTIFSASMGAAIVELLPGERLIVEDGMLMFHRAAGRFSGQFETGEVEESLRVAKRMVLRLEKKIAARLSMPIDAYKARVVNEWWLDSDEAIEAKAADRIVDVSCTAELVEGRIEETIATIFGEFKMRYSKCPIIRGPVL